MAVARAGLVIETGLDEVRGWYEAWNCRDWSAIEALLDDKVHLEDMALRRSVVGKADYMKYCRTWAEAFPDGRIKVERIIGRGRPDETIVVEYEGTGTQSGHFGLFPPSHRKASMKFCDLLRFECGKLVSIRTYTDMYGPLVALGHVRSWERVREQQGKGPLRNAS